MRLSRSQMEAGSELRRIEASRALAQSLFDRFPGKLANWDGDSLTLFVSGRSVVAQSFGLVSRADVYAFVETTLLLAPAFENTRQFRDLAAAAPDRNAIMIYVMHALPPGFISELTRADASSLWFARFSVCEL